MSANTSPIFTSSADVTWVPSPITSVVIGTGAAAYDGTSGTVLVHTAGVNGSFVQKLVCESFGANTNCVLRIYVNNGATSATASNNALYYQYSLPTVAQQSSIATTHVEIPLNLQLPASYRIFVGIGAAAALATGWMITCVAGEY